MSWFISLHTPFKSIHLNSYWIQVNSSEFILQFIWIHINSCEFKSIHTEFKSIHLYSSQFICIHTAFKSIHLYSSQFICIHTAFKSIHINLHFLALNHWGLGVGNFDGHGYTTPYPITPSYTDKWCISLHFSQTCTPPGGTRDSYCKGQGMWAMRER